MNEHIDGGIVITGGVSQIKGIKELAQLVFDDIPIKVSNPINIQNGYIDFNTPILSTVAGLLRYGLDKDPFFELDSTKELRGKKETKKQELPSKSNIDIQIDKPITTTIKLDNEKSKKSVWDKIGKWL
jgi:cell division protein FtsA